MKPGIRTSEFWATVAVDAAAFLTALEGALSPKWAAIAGAVATGLYSVSRGLAKQRVP